ncbi:T9SS type A sorting domain-containing protein [Flavobacterium pectinovorum]|uniref:T9SS type A sorting domain-containing protein n=1 Tax=Flavobacterium pectinovorum TaxID=29533 RepID=UPI00265F92D3|nr:T9SS type A sorting domain-containing protein [Flavobacterium pectinovorum]WKL49602.1 T9SS type A sorting domain-containing protein [Flavobacterium pectinovorum]
MKKTILIFSLLIVTKSISQIYFSSSEYMYVKNEVLYVQQDINMSSNSNLYLRNNSQLLQGTIGTSNNTGAGLLSVYQEGTSDNFEYNYWCSPVGNASASLGNENFGITMLNRPTSSIVSTPITVLPASNYNGTASPLSISSTWIYKLINANNYSQWIYVGGTKTLGPGEGFSMKGTSGTDTIDPEGTGITNNPGAAQRYDFRGKPNDGNITISLGVNNATLTGNPYPSALHLNAFLLDPSNAATGGVAYFWEQDKTVNSHYLTDYKGGYGSYSPVSLVSNGVYVPATFNSYNPDGSVNTTGSSSGLVIERKYSPVGQGFVISATATGTATFKNSHRAFYKEGNGLSKFDKHTPKQSGPKKEDSKETDLEEVSHFKLNVIINNQFTRQLALAFVPEATDGVDFGIDALNMDQALPNDVGFWIENGNYVIEGINFDETKKVPLALKATTSTTFKFNVPEVINFNGAQPIYIYDALDQSYHDVKNGQYEVNVLPGVYSDRFMLTFKNQISLGIDTKATKQFFIYQDNVNNNLTVSNPNALTLKSFKLYDMLGRVVLSKKDLGSDQNFIFSTIVLSDGVYISELLTIDNERSTEKIIISNSGK